MHMISEPGPLDGEEGSGHAPIFELSLHWNAGMTNQICWLQMMWLFTRLSVSSAT